MCRLSTKERSNVPTQWEWENSIYTPAAAAAVAVVMRLDWQEQCYHTELCLVYERTAARHDSCRPPSSPARPPSQPADVTMTTQLSHVQHACIWLWCTHVMLLLMIWLTILHTILDTRHCIIYTATTAAVGRVSYLIHVSARHYVLTTSGDIVVCFHTAVCLSC